VKKQDNILGVVPTPLHFVTLIVNLILNDSAFWDLQKSPEMFILDSSVGDGRFLFEFSKSWSNLSNRKCNITLHGLDIRQESIEKCITNQKQFSGDSNIKLSFKTGNALIGKHKPNKENVEESSIPIPGPPFHYYKKWPIPNRKDGYDICLGNPPFGLKLTIEEKNYFKHRYQSVDPEIESYILFVERSVQLLKEGGLLVLLIPSNFVTNYRYENFRNFLFKNLAMKKIIMLTDKVFPKAAVETCILMGYKDTRSISEKNHNIEFSEYSSKIRFSKIQKSRQDKLWEKKPRIIFPPKTSKYTEVLETVTRDSTKLGGIVNITRGIELGFHSKNTSDKEILSFVPVVAGRNIHKFFIDEKIRYIKFDESQKSIYKDINVYKQSKILLRRIGNKLIAAYDPNHLFCVCDVYIISLKPKWNHLNIRYLELLLNSSLFTFYLNHRFFSVKKLFPKIPISYLKELPIRISQDILEKKTLKNYLEETDNLEQVEEKRKGKEEMDHFIYKIYDLASDQIRIIESFCKNDL
jgi:hypothetical protein